MEPPTAPSVPAQAGEARGVRGACRPHSGPLEGGGWRVERVKEPSQQPIRTPSVCSRLFLFCEFKCILSHWVMSPGGNAQPGNVFKDYFLDHLSLSIWGTIVQSEKINSKLSPSKQDGKITFAILPFPFFSFFFLKKAYFWRTDLKIHFHLDILAGAEHGSWISALIIWTDKWMDRQLCDLGQFI